MTIHPLNKIKIIGTIMGVIALGLIIGIKAPDHATASANNNVHGWLWSDMPTGSDQELTPSNPYKGRGFGYVSMNSDDPGMSGTYGVNIDMSTGELSGQAYSEWNEWLNFDAAGPYPPYNAATSAKVQPSCWAQQQGNPQLWCNVIGWARFNGGMDPQSGGWDGWVSLNSDLSPSYHVAFQLSTGKFQGVAWGGADTGWINFDNVFADLVPPPLTCTDSSGATYTYTNPLQVPSQCTNLICYDSAGTAYTYAVGAHQPAACIIGTPVPDPVVDLCTNPGNPIFAGPQSVLPVFINGIWYNDPNNDGYCTKMANPPVFGCTDSTATNYNPLATNNDGSCTFDGGGGGSGGPIKPVYKEN